MSSHQLNEIGKRYRDALEKQSFHRLNIHLTYLFSVDSTQDFASRKLRSSNEGDIVISEIQTHGRGREGRPWISDKGGLWMTLTLVPPNPAVLEKVPFIAVNSIVESLNDFHVPSCRIKPPNDVYCKDRKIAGFLSDSRLQGNESLVYLGIGININNDVTQNETISAIATSVVKEIGHQVDMIDFTLALLKHLDLNYDSVLISLGL